MSRINGDKIQAFFARLHVHAHERKHLERKQTNTYAHKLHLDTSLQIDRTD